MSEPAGVARRAVLRHFCRGCGALAALAGAPPLWAQNDRGQPLVEGPARSATEAGAAPSVPGRFTRPGADTDEGGLWAMMDREETRLRRSPLLVRDAALGRLLQSMLCRLAGEHCADIRIHVVRTPLFNANMAPNGMLQLWSGLLLRIENEAQLAAVVGHELGHYLERHALEQLRDVKNRAAFAQFLALFGAVGALGQLGVLAGMFAFSREQELRADRLGMLLMKRAGYPARQATIVWDNLLGELKITGGAEAGRRSPMFATHPPVENRRDELLRLAGEGSGPAMDSGDTGAQAWAETVAPLRLGWMHDELRRGQYEESLVLFSRLLALREGDVLARYARGETHRLRAGKDDTQRALHDLVLASGDPAAPVEVYRSLGLLHRTREDFDSARQAFGSYLAQAPQAADAALIQHYLSEMKP
jgi:predicted Zn-dependent protease